MQSKGPTNYMLFNMYYVFFEEPPLTKNQIYPYNIIHCLLVISLYIKKIILFIAKKKSFLEPKGKKVNLNMVNYEAVICIQIFKFME